MILKKNQVLCCPMCGKMRLWTTFHMRERLEINEKAEIIGRSTKPDAIIFKHPDESTFCTCANCGHEAPMKDFVCNLFADAAFTNCTSSGGLTKKQQNELLDNLHPDMKRVVPHSFSRNEVLFCGFMGDKCLSKRGEINDLLWRLSWDTELHNKQEVYDVDDLRIKLV